MNSPTRNTSRWYCTRWTLRLQDIVHNYHPDLIYFDGTPYPFSGLRGRRGMATDSMQRIAADFYNTNTKEHGGTLEAVLNLKQSDPAEPAASTGHHLGKRDGGDLLAGGNHRSEGASLMNPR